MVSPWLLNNKHHMSIYILPKITFHNTPEEGKQSLYQNVEPYQLAIQYVTVLGKITEKYIILIWAI